MNLKKDTIINLLWVFIPLFILFIFFIPKYLKKGEEAKHKYAELKYKLSCSTYPLGQEYPDPTNTWATAWIEATENQLHQLILKNLKTKETRLLCNFHRSVKVIWAPDGRSLSITDFTGSDESLLYVAFPDKKELVNIEKTFINQFGKIPDIYINGHRYFEATKWLSAKELEFTIRAYDSRPDNAEYFSTYIYTLDDGIKMN